MIYRNPFCFLLSNFFKTFYNILFQKPLVVFLSDFGNTDAVATCKQAIYRVNQSIQIIDFNHNISPFNIAHASLILERSKDFPCDTVFLAVVDPGVGTDRLPIIVKAGNKYFVGPNNGIFSKVIDVIGLESAFAIIPTNVNKNWTKLTFDGRDLYAPAAAMIANSKGRCIRKIGLEIEVGSLIKLPFEVLNPTITEEFIKSNIIAFDEPFGNVWTNIEEHHLKGISGKMLNLTIFSNQNEIKINLSIPIVSAFAEVSYYEPLAYFDSRHGLKKGYLALALNSGDFRKRYNLNSTDYIIIEKS